MLAKLTALRYSAAYTKLGAQPVLLTQQMPLNLSEYSATIVLTKLTVPDYWYHQSVVLRSWVLGWWFAALLQQGLHHLQLDNGLLLRCELGYE